MTEYPILVKKWDAKHPPDLAVCEKCHHEERYDPAEGTPEDVMTCSACGAFAMTSKYDVGSECKGCGKLGYFEKVLNYCCSRRCMLQREYLESLHGRR